MEECLPKGMSEFPDDCGIFSFKNWEKRIKSMRTLTKVHNLQNLGMPKNVLKNVYVNCC